MQDQQDILLSANLKKTLAVTNLAATNFQDFTSFHFGFVLPVVEDYEIEEGIRLKCQLKDKPGRQE